jgi:uncharacterized protein with GYD domain
MEKRGRMCTTDCVAPRLLREEVYMATFILAMKYHGPRPDFSETLDERNTGVMRLLEACGGSLVAFYRTQGRFDAFAVLDMPDAETIQAFNIANQSPEWTIETMRAFTTEEYPAIWSRAADLLDKAGTE